uniref:STE20/SPS1-related proline-alanine-rich protein kinase-like n=1 Tax=Erigeron canadensis TaxID=72917 RepID=UPI001CB98FCD|nr:STE20/SPS1-related proline-alanine-rich protein kinase-like [Erigeron canadensis]XP_043640282.1 STE20/SPS1-related proline-alanine-rich protein kinase-like [Erigeron canadensis]
MGGSKNNNYLKKSASTSTSSSSGGFTTNPQDYQLLEEVGYGASATVYRAIYLPSNDVVAVKSLDLERINSNLDDIRREAQTMSLIDHPNVIRAFCSFVVNQNLWVVMPFMAEGSCLHLMKTAYPDGFEESAIASILKETLKALEYLHQHGHIHRDVKAGNILLDTNGVIKLGDFGVSACMFDRGDRQRSRNTFVGTPCWMAPEVLQPGSGYDFKADIWSFGITALELAHGHAPFSKYPPMKVLLMTIQNAPPGLDYDRDKRFSKSFKELVAMCLVKDQTKRPTAEKLLKHSFFKQAKPPELSVKKLFTDLPPLWHRVKALQIKDAAQLALKKMPSAEQEAISQSEYQRGVSAWNFDVQDLKFKASLVQDDDEIQDIREDDVNSSSYVNNDASDSKATSGKQYSTNESVCSDEVVPSESISNKEETPESNVLEDNKGTTDLEKSRIKAEQLPSTSDKEAKTRILSARNRQTQSGPLVAGVVLNHSKSERSRNFERSDNGSSQAVEKVHQVRRAPSFSGPLNLPNRASGNSLSAPIKPTGGYRDSMDDKSKANLVQIKGRFSVTSEDLDLVKDIPLYSVPRRSPQDASLRKSASVGDWIFDSNKMPTPREINSSSVHSNLSASVLMPHLQNLFQQTSLQQDLILSLLNSLQSSEVAEASQNGKLPPLPRSSENNGSVEVSDRERLLLTKVSELQSRLTILTEELTTEKLKYVQLQERVDAITSREDGQKGESDA